MAQILGAIAGVFMPTLLFNFVLKKARKVDTKLQRLNSVVLAVLFASSIYAYLGSSTGQAYEEIVNAIGIYIIGGIVVAVIMIKRFNKDVAGTVERSVETVNDRVKRYRSRGWGFFWFGLIGYFLSLASPDKFIRVVNDPINELMPALFGSLLLFALNVFFWIGLGLLWKADKIEMPERRSRWRKILISYAVYSFLMICWLGYLIAIPNMIRTQTATDTPAVFSSQEFNYSISVPPQWLILKRKDLVRFNQAFSESDAEVALVSKDQLSYCMIIPEDLAEIKEDLQLEDVKDFCLNLVKGEVTNTIINTNDLGENSFEIIYDSESDKNVRKFILYSMHENLGISFVSVINKNKLDETYSEVKSIFDNIRLGI